MNRSGDDPPTQEHERRGEQYDATSNHHRAGHSGTRCRIRGGRTRGREAVWHLQCGLESSTISTDDAKRTLVALLQAAHATGTTVDHLAIHAPTLEEVFLKLTGRALRD